MSYKFENVSYDHKKAITDIFNYYVVNSFAAYPTSPVGDALFDRFYDMSSGYPFKVITYNTKEIVGFAFLHPYHLADSFSKTAEITYFILPDHTGKGLATKILNLFISIGKKQGIMNLLANISSLNEGSINFHKKNGFVECGRFKNIGHKFNKDFDVVWMQLNINEYHPK